MAKLIIVALALAGCAVAEPPVGYSYSAPSSLLVVGGGHGSYSSPLSSGGHYTPVPVGHQTSEGYHLDPHLLEKIRHIILKDEIHNQAYQSSHSSHGISSHYGAPAPVYGVPHERIVGVELESLQQGIQVAQYHQDQEVPTYAGGYSGGYSSGYSGSLSGGHGYSGSLSSGHGYSGSLSSGHGYSSSLSSGHGYSGSLSGGLSSGHGSISYSSPSSSYTTIGVPSGSYGVPPSSSYGTPH